MKAHAHTLSHDFGCGAGDEPAHRHPNGGGWVADTAQVDATAYVGPDAQVSGEAQVFGKAWVSGEARVGEILSGVSLDGVPVVERLHARMAEATATPGALAMDSWHCGTSHCRAGWAITLAGPAGAALERRVGSWLAGALIYAASTGRKEVPDFFASDADALEDIRRCAEVAS